MDQNNISNSNSESSQVVAAEYLENFSKLQLKKKSVNFYMLIIHDIIKFLPVYAWNFYCIF